MSHELHSVTVFLAYIIMVFFIATGKSESSGSFGGGGTEAADGRNFIFFKVRKGRRRKIKYR